VQRLRAQQHHVVGDVDDVVDRPLPGRGQAGLQPKRRGSDGDVGEDASGEARAELGNLDRDRSVVSHVSPALGNRVLRPGLGSQRRRRDRVDLAGDSPDAEAVDPVRRHLQLEHRLGQRQNLRQRRSRRWLSIEHEDAVGVVADFQLGDGEDHPLRGDPPQLRLAQLLAARHSRPGQGHGDGLAGGDVGGAADDRPLILAVTGVDGADPQPVGVGVRLGAEHPADDEALGRGRADGADPLDLGPGHHQPLGDLRDPDAGVAVLTQP
jgi:hypothetical protein